MGLGHVPQRWGPNRAYTLCISCPLQDLIQALPSGVAPQTPTPRSMTSVLRKTIFIHPLRTQAIGLGFTFTQHDPLFITQTKFYFQVSSHREVTGEREYFEMFKSAHFLSFPLSVFLFFPPPRPLFVFPFFFFNAWDSWRAHYFCTVPGVASCIIMMEIKKPSERREQVDSKLLSANLWIRCFSKGYS